MPIYEYRCSECGHEMEVWAKISDPPPEACPSCRAAAMKKAVSRTTFALKGGGWYAQGYGGGGGGGGGASKSSESKPAETKTEKSSTSTSAD
jgi:putative FmdB family regulatory protein